MTSNSRPGKGKSIIAFPESYVAIDLETTGCSLYFDRIIEIGAVRIEGGKRTETFQELVNPGFEIGSFIEDLTGITNEMLSEARDECAVLTEFRSFLRTDDVLVGHNIVAFDANFLYDAFARLGQPFSWDLVDTMRIGRKVHPEWEHHRLCDLRYRYDIPDTGAHRALKDALDAAFVLEALKGDVESRGLGLEDFCRQAKKKANKPPRPCELVPTVTEFDDAHPFYGKEVAITGALGHGWTRAMGQQAVVDCGGIPVSRFKMKSTNFLVVGDYSASSHLGQQLSSQHLNALKAKQQGKDVEIIDPETFFDLVGAEFDMS